MRQILVVLVTLLLCISCKSTTYTAESTDQSSVNIEYRDRLVYDSLYIKDSVYVYVKGDTIVKYKEKYDTRIVHVTDTVIRVDTLITTVTNMEVQVKEVNRLHWWQKCLMYLGLVMLMVIILRLIRK